MNNSKRFLLTAAITLVMLGGMSPKAKADVTINDPLAGLSKHLVNLNTLVNGAEYIGATVLAFVVGATLVKHVATK
jgi:hypothetical protein